MYSKLLRKLGIEHHRPAPAKSNLKEDEKLEFLLFDPFEPESCLISYQMVQQIKLFIYKL